MGFKIIREQIFESEAEDQLFIMLISDHGLPTIRIDSRENCLCLRPIEGLSSAIRLYDLFCEKIMNVKSGETAIKLSKLLGLFSDEDEALFYFQVFNRRYSQAQIGAMSDEYKFEIDSKITPIDGSELEAMKIIVTLPGKNRPIGQFVGTFTKSDFRFQVNRKALVDVSFEILSK